MGRIFLYNHGALDGSSPLLLLNNRASDKWARASTVEDSGIDSITDRGTVFGGHFFG